MPPRGLPGNANLEQLRNGAKSFQRAVRSGDPGAAEVVREFHPRLSDARPTDLQGFTRTDAQLVVARQFGFASWPKLKAHLELVAAYARSPHAQPIGGSLVDEPAIADEFLRLACLNYGDDDPARRRRAGELLDARPWLARANIYTAAAVADLPAARERLAADPACAGRQGGPFDWPPLLYLTYSRVPNARGSAVPVARLLLEHGADPNAGYLWEGLVPPFTALTGVFGDGEGGQPAHPEWPALARLLLEAGADPNDGQTLYNRGWGAARDQDWLELLLEFGLGRGDGGPWRRLLGDRQDSPQEMLEDLLMAAAHHGLADRARLLLDRGVDAQGRGSRHPVYGGRSPVQEAALWGRTDIVELLVDAGAPVERDAVDTLIMLATAGDREAVDRLIAGDPGLPERAIARRPDQLVRAAEANRPDAVALLIDLGFDVNAVNRTAALHEAAMRGNLEVIGLLFEHGADPNVRDAAYHATPAGWADHHGQREAKDLLDAHAGTA